MKTLLLWLMTMGVCGAAQLAYVDLPEGVDFPASETHLEAWRSSGDLPAERAHMWSVYNGLTRVQSNDSVAPFLTWFGAGEVFEAADSERPRQLARAFSLPAKPRAATVDSSAPPRITRVHYNLAALRHIRGQGLFSLRHLGQLSESVPAFPRTAVVLKTVWWPIPAEGVVALPVWDPDANPPLAGGNDYPSWTRVVAVASGRAAADGCTDIVFLGKAWKAVQKVSVDSMYHVVLDRELSAELMQDPEALKLATMLLSRPLEAGDSIALVAMHVATREITSWTWGTFWWHDAPDEGPHAAGRPLQIAGVWRHYLMDVSFDSALPREVDGRPHVAFNPWLEARFVDSGQGNGTVSNCMTCHGRASTALSAPFAVTRGTSKLSQSPPQVKTSFLWTLPMQAR